MSEQLLNVAVVGATASCPGNSPIHTNVVIRGTHTYSINNTSGTTITATLTVKLTDSDGHHITETETIIVAAGDTENGSKNTALNVAYNTSGTKTVTATSSLSGDVTASKSGTCSFQVHA